MKNKKYKRLAKRMKGYCLEKGTICSIGTMKICKYFDQCAKHCGNNFVPRYLQLRELELLCKNN